MADPCPNCRGVLTASGLCMRCGHRVPGKLPSSRPSTTPATRASAPPPPPPPTPSTSAAPVPGGPAPSPGSSGTSPSPGSYGAPPSPGSYSTPPPAATYASPPSPGSYGAPPPASYGTPPSPGSYSAPPAPGAAPASSAVTQGAFGALRVRGDITEIGVERMESVNLQGTLALKTVGSGLLTAVPRAIGIMLGILFAPLRLLLIPSLMGIGKRAEGPDRLQVPVTPFVVTLDDGTGYDCIIRGEVRGGFLKLGEPVEIVGRLDRSRVLRVDSVQSLRTHAITKGWVDPKARFAPAAGCLGVVIVVMLIAFLISLVGMFTG